ncbi:acetyl-CoA carboxylase biotin carboxylase subunit [soil metagenome]
MGTFPSSVGTAQRSGVFAQRHPDSSVGQKPPFEGLLVANRGEIAIRIIRACRELGVRSIAVFSDADADAPHVVAADSAIRLGPAAPSESYLRADLLVEVAVAQHCQAVHPGYGFLSERASFAAACADAGLTFIGPSPATLAGLGDKLAARRAAARAGVPLIPGTSEPAAVEGEGLDRLATVAEEIGFPLLVKASAGGGGRGMRRVDDGAALGEALKAASREAEAAFGDGAVYLEKYVETGRHVEVQLLGDHEGAVVALGERDCSVQRRHQKLVEEAPAPGLTANDRSTLHAHAVRVARAVGLRNAATAEFLLTPDGQFWFLEVNARLQVEHGISELVTGLDLVHEQLWIAAGRPLSEQVHAAAREAALPRVHALEVRISAEDPGHDFRPVPGRIGEWREPAGPGVRVDSSVWPGTWVPPEYDPLLAKVMVVAADRPSAIARMRRALGELRVSGVQTTLPFHLWLMDQRQFVEADLSTDMVAQLWNGNQARSDAAAGAAHAAASAYWSASPTAASASASSVDAGRTGQRPPDPGWRSVARKEGIHRWDR